MNDQINLSNTQVSNFKSVWLELLKKKISIIYDISNHKNVDFIKLLKEFVPEAFDHKPEWEDLYIIKQQTPNFTNNVKNKDQKKDQNKDQKKDQITNKDKDIKKKKLSIIKQNRTVKSIPKLVTKSVTKSVTKKKFILKRK
jgi:hypothetical protein